MITSFYGVGNGGHDTRGPQRQYPHSPLEASMTRTYNPGYASYMGDGSGRDSYIILNNGGLTHQDKPYMMTRKNRPSPDTSPKPSGLMQPFIPGCFIKFGAMKELWHLMRHWSFTE